MKIEEKLLVPVSIVIAVLAVVFVSNFWKPDTKEDVRLTRTPIMPCTTVH